MTEKTILPEDIQCIAGQFRDDIKDCKIPPKFLVAGDWSCHLHLVAIVRERAEDMKYGVNGARKVTVEVVEDARAYIEANWEEWAGSDA